MDNLREVISRRVQAALAEAFGAAGSGTDPLVRAAQDPRFGDYQSNCAMGLAKRLGRKPREVAEALVAHLHIADVCQPPEIAGPGFINFTLLPSFLADALQTIPGAGPDGADRMGVPAVQPPQVVVVDMSSPNLAKEMHVGHLRPTIIGDAIARILEFQGHDVHRLNHVGDWGTQFGMLIEYVRETQPRVLDDPEHLRLGDLEEFYVQAKARFDSDPAFAARARQAVVDLQSGEPATRAVWKAFCEESMRHCHEIYDLLDVRVEDRGESFYNDMLAPTVAELQAKGLVTESGGALCIFLEGFTNRDGSPLPLIVRKSDGGYMYASTDLAALKHRIQVMGAERIIYVVGSSQKQHFEMLFAVLEKTGWGRGVQVTHLPTGILLKEDGKPFKTREGGTVKLRALLDEAIDRSRSFLQANEQREDKRRGYAPEQIEVMARIIGPAAVKYFELSHNLTTDYKFEWDLMLALDGNTAPYMLYTYARIRSIAAKAAEAQAAPASSGILLEHPAEIALARQILRFAEMIDQLARELRPNLLTEYLFDLSKRFSNFYDRTTGVRVIDAETPAARRSRLALCELTGRTLKLGLGLLGIRTLERM